MRTDGDGQTAVQVEALLKLMQGWPGETLDGQGFLRVLNAGGRKTPLFWVFNARHEPENFARCLGPDQPLVYTRSFHLVVPPGGDFGNAYEALSARISGSLVTRFGGCGLFLGANCQGAGLLAPLTRRLREGGASIPGLCLVAALPDYEFRLPALLVYGSRDPHHDPFFHDAVSAQKKADRCFTTVRRIVVDAAHGEYATVSVGTVVARIQDFLSSRSARPAHSV